MREKIYTYNAIPIYDDQASTSHFVSFLSIIATDWESEYGEKLIAKFDVEHTTTTPLMAEELQYILEGKLLTLLEHPVRLKPIGKITYGGKYIIVNGQEVLSSASTVDELSAEGSEELHKAVQSYTV